MKRRLTWTSVSIILFALSGRATAAITGLRVQGNQIVDGSGQPVVLHGVNKSGTEYACAQGWGIFDGPSDAASVQTMAAWKGMNAVRVPLNESCWLGINGAPAQYSGANYQTAINTYVNLLVQNNLIPILEVHWTAPGTALATGQQPMLNRDHSVEFWRQVATAYKNNSSVILDLHNEPYPDNNSDTAEAWRCWRDGGTCRGMNFQAAGMQEVVNAVRTAGSTHVLMLGGVQYSNALSQWLAYKPTDPLNNLVASWHMYGGNVCMNATCWNSIEAPLAQQVPLVAGEFGEHYDGAHCTNTLVNTFTAWADARNIGYVAWTFNNWGDCLSLISNDAGTAITSWGTFYKNHLAALAAPSDTTPPTVSLSAPASGAAVNGSAVTVSAAAADNVGVAGVQFKLDGANLGAEDASSPYSVSWNSTLASNGAHTLTAVARDGAGNTTASAAVGVTVSNAADTTPPVISGVAANNLTAGGATIVWTTNESADAQVNYGPTASYGSSTTLNANLLTSHSQTLSGLAAGTVYHYRVRSKDAAGNPAASGDFTFTTPSAGGGGTVAMPVISRNKPAYASAGTAGAGNNANYDDVWGAASVPAWLAYDLSSVPPANRGAVIVGLYNDPITSPYDHTVVGEVAYNNIGSYTLQGNAAAGGGSAPAAGWVTLATVTNNKYHSRQHLVNMTGYNWIRLNVTASDGSSGNTGAALNMDVHDAGQGATDSWIFIGDSITMDGMHHETVNGTGNFSQLINAAQPAYFPAAEDGGIGGLTSAEGAANIAAWLNVFPGKYVGLAYGTNDANGGNCGTAAANTFYNNYATMVQAVINAGKIPVVPTIPASKTSGVQTCGPVLNAKLQTLTANFPQVISGPDLWTYFQNNPTLISGDNLHPSAAGYAGMRQQWANAMAAKVYNAAPPPADTTPPTVSLTNPANNATVSGPITLTGTASDNVGVAGVQFKFDGADLGTEDTAAPYTRVFYSTTVANGAHQLTAVARDAAGNSATSAVVNITVSNTSSDTTPPTVAITSPANNAVVTGVITVSGTAADNIGVAGVQFKFNGTNLGAEDTVAPFTTTLDPATLPVSTTPSSGKVGWSSGFYPGWLQPGLPPSALPWAGITHLIQFSVMTGAARNGSINTTAHGLSPALMQAAVAETHKRGKKILISIGGAEDNNWDGACSPANRTTFVNNIVNLVKQYGYDGVDLDIEQDWQSPAHTDYIACVAAVRSGLDTISPRPLLTEDGDPDWQAYMLAKVWQYLDQINLMSYWTDAGASVTGLNNYTSVGVPKSLLGIGVGTDDGGIDGTNPADCQAKAQYAAANGYGGVMTWTVPGDALLHNGQTPCFDGIAPFLSATPSNAGVLTAVARDAAGNTAVSAPINITFGSGGDTTPPVISGVAVAGLGVSSATIAWTTNEAADTQVEYGLTTGYGTSTALNATKSTGHSGLLSGLAANTLYHFRARSRDAAGNLAVSGDFTFKTRGGKPGDLNNDTVVDIVDLSVLLSRWNSADPVADINDSGVVDVTDLSILLTNWDRTSPSTQSFVAPAVNNRLAAAFRLVPRARRSDTEPLIVDLYIDTPQPVNAVQACLAYPADKVELTKVSGAGSAFDIEGPRFDAPGLVSIVRGSQEALAGRLPIAQLVFAAPTEDAVTLAFTNGSMALRAADAVNVLAKAPTAELSGRPSSPRFLSPSLKDGVNDAVIFDLDTSRVAIVDVNGRRVFEAESQAGTSIVWAGRDNSDHAVPSGVYIATLEKTDGTVEHRTMVVAK